MAKPSIEERLSALETAVAELQQRLNPSVDVEDRVAKLELAVKGEFPAKK